MDVPLQVMDLQVKYHYSIVYTMCTLQDMDLNQELNQSVTDSKTKVTWLYEQVCIILVYGQDYASLCRKWENKLKQWDL